MIEMLVYAVCTCTGAVLGGVASILIREQILKWRAK